MIKPRCSNFRVITANFSDVQIFYSTFQGYSPFCYISADGFSAPAFGSLGCKFKSCWMGDLEPEWCLTVQRSSHLIWNIVVKDVKLPTCKQL